MGAYVVAGGVDERGFGSLKYPLWAGGGLLASIDLNAFTGDGEDGVLRGRWGGGILRGILRGRDSCDGECCGEDEEETGFVAS